MDGTEVTDLANPLVVCDCGPTTHLQLLNTVSNLGGTWPRYFVLRGVDTFTKASCLIHSEGGSDITVSAQECVSDHGKAVCADLGGVCRTDRDGYYITTMICIALGAALLIGFVQPTARKLQSEWKKAGNGLLSLPVFRESSSFAPPAPRWWSLDTDLPCPPFTMLRLIHANPFSRLSFHLAFLPAIRLYCPSKGLPGSAWRVKLDRQ